jgi:phosphatidylinositol 4-kinase
MALSLLQSSSSLIPNTISKCVLRERIYFTALNYFTVPSRIPTQSNADLREDLKFILEFWNRIVAEKKYLKEENFIFTGSSN